MRFWGRFGGLAWLGGALACGLHSDPLFMGAETEGATSHGTADVASACDDVQGLPLENITLRGELAAQGRAAGWCGQDRGGEIAYELTPAYNIDVNLSITEANSPLTLRVLVDGCADDGQEAIVCATDIVDRPLHFLAQVGHTYTIMVDGEQPGPFALSLVYGWPTLDQCPIHDEVIVQEPGGWFRWYNRLGSGQGEVDGVCGGPGRENMFPIRTSYSGWILADAQGDQGFRPVLSLRTSCAAVSELVCDADETASLSWYIEDPSQTYYLVVDSQSVVGGGYALSVSFD